MFEEDYEIGSKDDPLGEVPEWARDPETGIITDQGVLEGRKRKYQELMSQDLEEKEYFIQGVGGSDTSMPFMYTVGLSRLDIPELVVTGLSGANGESWLIDHAIQGHKDGRWNLIKDDAIDFGGELDDGSKSVPFPLVDIPFQWKYDHMTQTQAQFGEPMWPARQIVWSNGIGQFPWDNPPYEETPFSEQQEILGQVPKGTLEEGE